MASDILIVDDDPAVLEGVATLLDQAGYTTQRAASGAAALDRLATPPCPDLVILDVMMPGIDGYQVCRHLRQITRYIPILMLTARDELTDKIVGLELGADEYVTKPFEPRELLARVRAMLRFAEQRAVGQPPAEQVLICGPIELWKAAHQLVVRGQTIELAPREWTLLEFFMEHPNQIFGRETLLRRIWGYAVPGDTHG
jgi:DNA-binding response OmpR family regulator